MKYRREIGAAFLAGMVGLSTSERAAADSSEHKKEVTISTEEHRNPYFIIKKDGSIEVVPNMGAEILRQFDVCVLDLPLQKQKELMRAAVKDMLDSRQIVHFFDFVDLVRSVLPKEVSNYIHHATQYMIENPQEGLRLYPMVYKDISDNKNIFFEKLLAQLAAKEKDITPEKLRDRQRRMALSQHYLRLENGTAWSVPMGSIIQEKQIKTYADLYRVLPYPNERSAGISEVHQISTSHRYAALFESMYDSHVQERLSKETVIDLARNSVVDDPILVANFFNTYGGVYGVPVDIFQHALQEIVARAKNSEQSREREECVDWLFQHATILFTYLPVHTARDIMLRAQEQLRGIENI